MRQSIKAKLSYANVMATLAMFVALAGGTTAIALTAGKNTVTTKSIKPGNVTARDLGPIKTVSKSETMLGDSHIIRIFCPPKSRALSGGGVGGGSDGEVRASYPVAGGWQVNFSGTGPSSVLGFVLCLSSKAGKPQNR